MRFGLNSRRVIVLIVLAMAAASAILWTHGIVDAPLRSRMQRQSLHPRVVSLSPPLTETVTALGAADLLVGISDYCKVDSTTTAHRVGSSVAPDYEAIARLQPTLILTEAGAAGELAKLEPIARTEAVAWLTLGDLKRGILRLGDLLGRGGEARGLWQQLARQMRPERSERRPRRSVLLVIGADPNLTRVYFARSNSIHGAALEAAGATNAVRHSIRGVPSLTAEQLVSIDPWAVLILATARDPSNRTLEAPWKALVPLRAPRAGRVRVVRSPTAFSTGPSIGLLVQTLRKELDSMSNAAGRAR